MRGCIKLAFIQCDFFSETLGLSTSMNVILPEKTTGQIGMENKQTSGKHQTLYLLHGLSDDHTIWTRRTSIERYVASLGLAVVMPQVDRSFYTDMKYGNRYWTFLTEELPTVVQSMFPLSDRREDNFVAGLSMGGYGALKWALRHPEQFAAAASLSGATDVASRVKQSDGQNELFHLIFGDDDITGTPDDLLWLIKQNSQHHNPQPELFQWCGTEDFLYDQNVAFKETCARHDYPLTTEFSSGDHNWAYWDEKIQDVLKWLPLKSHL